MRHRSDRQPGPRDAAFGSISGGGLASACVAPVIEGGGDEVGVRTLKRAIFLDRDGVLNEAVVRNGKPYPPASAAEVVLVDGAAEGLARMKELGV